MFYWVQVWRLARPLQDLEMLLTEPLLSCPCCVFACHSHAGRPSHDPSSMLLMGEGGCWPKSRDRWPHLSSPQYGAVILSPLQKSTPKAWFPPPCFMVGMVFLRLYSSFFLQTLRVEFIPKSYILVSSDHMDFSHASSGSSRWSLANIRWAWTCAGLSRGTLRVLQDFNPWRCSEVLMVTVETVVPALFRSLTRSSRE